MRFEYSEPQTELERVFGGFYHINALGSIELGDAERFQALLENAAPPPITTVYINSPGGIVDVAIELGRAIRRNSLWTAVGTYTLSPEEADRPIIGREFTAGICLSAATLVYLGGRFRFLDKDSQFGVHQFRFEKDLPDGLFRSQVLSAKIAKFLHEMGIAPRFLERAASVPSSDLESLDHTLLRELGVVNDAVGQPQWSVEARNNTIYVKAERDTVYGYQKLCFGRFLDGEFYLHGIFDPQGRAAEIVSMACVEITLNGEDHVIDVTDRVFRTEINSWLNAVVKLSLVEAELLVNSRSFGIRFRHSKEGGIFLGIDSIDACEAKEKLKTVFALSAGRQ